MVSILESLERCRSLIHPSMELNQIFVSDIDKCQPITYGSIDR